MLIEGLQYFIEATWGVDIINIVVIKKYWGLKGLSSL